MATVSDVSKVISNILVPLSFSIKPKQLEAVVNILNGVDTLCIFPTCYGKSLIYQLLPSVCLELNIAPSPLVLVVSPLISLIQDQVSSANSLSALGLKASKLDCDDYGDIISGNFNILIGTPESWLNNARWRQFLSSKFVLDNAVCLVVDEVHKVSWYGVFIIGAPKLQRKHFQNVCFV
ncbi:putative ATP-dependent DNA helicase Q1 [Hydractinia symbiolongicarpus]|uniref:putative ATP-dependent DNA helicase Q1 n=1 Tax=Hydractinia symbiolongicarpus TaxID=13093 RepID=UPI002551B22F|nr:putative ATP-dependent DNA helicase Q1 [Hydractinia symbiolongicarpus]XP_057302712.1 putative ATP-dependent DNA helicase Q1 [Hydractinia symbiolongicarpus]